MKHAFTFLFTFLALQAFCQQADSLKTYAIGTSPSGKAKAVFSGKISDEAGGEPITGAILQMKPGNASAETDAQGKFRLSVQPGTYELTISYLGYETFAANIELSGDGSQDFSINAAAVELGEVTVTDRWQRDNVSLVLSGVEQLTIEKIERQTKLLGEADVLRSLQAVTGVTSVGEGASGFNVRGGNTDENLIFMDGNLIFNPVHALGFFSLFHPDMVSGVTLYKGGAPARYGGRLSSVLDVQLREGNDERLAMQGGLGVASSRLAVEGPIVKDKASFVVGARASYFDWILKRTKNADLHKSEAFFYDITAKADARLGKTTKTGFTLFAAHDDFRFADEVKFDYETRSGSAYIKQLVGEKINLSALVNAGQYTSALYDIEGNDQSKFINRINYLRGTLSAYYQLAPANSLEIGASQTRYDVSPGNLEPQGTSILQAEKLPKERGAELSLFAQNQWQLSKSVEIMLGVRHTFYRNFGPDEVYIYQNGTPKVEETIADSLQFSGGEKIAAYSGFEPRFSLRVNLSENSSLKMGYNRSFQYLNQVSNTASATPIDVWQLSNYHVEPQKADNFSVGYHRSFRENGLQSYLTVFYRRIARLVDYKDFARLLLNQHVETELLSGRGKAYGVEFYFNKSFGRHQVELNYTFSRSLRKVEATAEQEAVNAGKWYPSNYDKPHNLNLNYFFQMGKRVSFSANFTYSTGRPTTAPVSSYGTSNVMSIPIYSDRNQYRIPDYHRLDLALTIGPWGHKKTWRNSLSLSVYNLYFRKNAYSVFFRQKIGRPVVAYRVAVLGSAFPAITYNFKF